MVAVLDDSLRKLMDEVRARRSTSLSSRRSMRTTRKPTARGGAMVAAFRSLGWAWGGRWISIKNCQHPFAIGRSRRARCARTWTLTRVDGC